MGRIIGLVLGAVAIVNGLGVVFDGECDSVSFGGQGGGRVLMATCFSDSSGALPGAVAGLGMALLGGVMIVFSIRKR